MHLRKSVLSTLIALTLNLAFAEDSRKANGSGTTPAATILALKTKIACIHDLACKPDSVPKEVAQDILPRLTAYEESLLAALGEHISATSERSDLAEDDKRILVAARTKELEDLKGFLDNKNACGYMPRVPVNCVAASERLVSTVIPSDSASSSPVSSSDLNPSPVLIRPDMLQFGSNEVLTTIDKTFSVTNKGPKPITLNDPQVDCDPSTADEPKHCPFTIEKTGEICSNTLESGDHCDFKVTFQPYRQQKFDRKVTVSWNAVDGAASPGTVDVLGKGFVSNVVGLDGDGATSSSPSTRSVVGFDLSGASSSDTQAKAFLEFDLNVPLFGAGQNCTKSEADPASPSKKICRPRRDPLNSRWWAFFNPRITSLPQSPTPLSNLNVQGFTDFFGSKNTDLVQGFDAQGGLEYLLVKPRDGIPFFSSIKNMRARIGIALVAGGGFTSPFSTPSANRNQTVFALPSNSPLRTTFNIPASFTNIAFVDEERSRFFRKWFTGIRLKTYHFSKFADGLCDWLKTEKPCEALHNSFPGITDLTVGQDEQVTAGHLSSLVFRLDTVYPLPFPGFHIFGSLNSAFQKNELSAPVVLGFPTTPAVATDSSVFLAVVQPRSRDIYRVGLGLDLIQVINSRKKTAAANLDDSQPELKTRPQQPARSTASEVDKSTIQQPEKKEGADQAASSNPGVPKNK
jgi:hypothetical protein